MSVLQQAIRERERDMASPIRLTKVYRFGSDRSTGYKVWDGGQPIGYVFRRAGGKWVAKVKPFAEVGMLFDRRYKAVDHLWHFHVATTVLSEGTG